MLKFKPLTISNLHFSHRQFVSTLAFIPKDVKVDRRATLEGKITYFISSSEDGLVLIWDVRTIEKDMGKSPTDQFWKPSL